MTDKQPRTYKLSVESRDRLPRLAKRHGLNSDTAVIEFALAYLENDLEAVRRIADGRTVPPPAPVAESKWQCPRCGCTSFEIKDGKRICHGFKCGHVEPPAASARGKKGMRK